MLTLARNLRGETVKLLRLLSLRYRTRCNIKLCSKTPIVYTVPPGNPGEGAGKGGGGGGSIREAGGGLGRLGAALEEGYFHQQQKEQLKQIKQKLQRGEQIGYADKPPK